MGVSFGETRMKTWIATLLTCGALLAPGRAMAGDMTPPAGPDQPTMNTLQEVHDDVQALEDRLNYVPPRKTGQTTSYQPRDDGELRPGVPWPDPRFTDNGDGTVTDNLTGLIWLQDAYCFGLRSWETLMDEVNTLEPPMCGLSDGSRKGDWRMPNVRELLSLVDFEEVKPSLPDGHPFINAPAAGGDVDAVEHYFTSTAYLPGAEKQVWMINIHWKHMGVLNKNDPSKVWPVRGGMYGQ